MACIRVKEIQKNSDFFKISVKYKNRIKVTFNL